MRTIEIEVTDDLLAAVERAGKDAGSGLSGFGISEIGSRALDQLLKDDALLALYESAHETARLRKLAGGGK